MVTQRNTTTALAAIKLGIFTVVSVLVTGLLAVIMGHFGFGGQTEYKAAFANASSLQKGDDVRIAGVSVGEVKGVEILGRTRALVTFKVSSDVPMTTASRAEIRFLNLVGDRYMSLSEGTPDAQRLHSDATIPMSRTTPALNLSELFNGFQPLFQALSPKDVNQLSMNLIKVLQGEGGTVQSLLANTASLTNTLADRDQLVGEVVNNLSSVLKTVDDRHVQLNQLVVQLRGWLGNLSRDRKTIGASVHNLSGLTATVADLLTQSRPYLKGDVAQLRRLVAVLTKPENKAVLDEALRRLPLALTRQTRTGTYGSWYNYYLCDFSGSIILPKIAGVNLSAIQARLTNLSFYSTAERCK